MCVRVCVRAYVCASVRAFVFVPACICVSVYVMFFFKVKNIL